MKQRCTNPRLARFQNYGGRGISVCERWSTSFPNFLADMGERPSAKHSLERLNNDGNYELSNVVWALPAQQRRNRPDVRMLELDGVRMCLRDWSRKYGVNRSTLARRLNTGWDLRRALTEPPHF